MEFKKNSSMINLQKGTSTSTSIIDFVFCFFCFCNIKALSTSSFGFCAAAHPQFGTFLSIGMARVMVHMEKEPFIFFERFFRDVVCEVCFSSIVSFCLGLLNFNYTKTQCILGSKGQFQVPAMQRLMNIGSSGDIMIPLQPQRKYCVC
jgi:hypothetical protein